MGIARSLFIIPEYILIWEPYVCVYIYTHIEGKGKIKRERERGKYVYVKYHPTKIPDLLKLSPALDDVL